MKRSKIGQEMKWDLTYNIAFLGKNNPECKHEMTRRYWQSSKIKQNLLGQKSKKKNKMGISLQWDMAAKPTKVTLGGLQSTACPVQGDDRSFSLHTDGNLQVRDSKAPPQKQGNNLDIRQKNVNHKSSWTVTEHGRLGWQWGKAHGYSCARGRGMDKSAQRKQIIMKTCSPTGKKKKGYVGNYTAQVICWLDW